MLRIARPARNEGGLVHQIAVIVGVSVLSGVLIAGLALPWIGLAKEGAERSAAAIENFPLELKFQPLSERTKVLDSQGNRLATFFDENRQYVGLDKISKEMQEAIVAIEDSRFYEHGAIDVEGTLRALIVNQANSGVVQGGSSITQQLVKLTRIENAGNNARKRAAAQDDSFARKFAELRYAVWVEDHLTKDEILEHYLNTAYFGDGAYGIEAAAHHYFSVPASKLNLNQSALLAGLVRSPNAYNPFLDRQAAIDRRDVVVNRMLELHLVSARDAREVKKSELQLKKNDVANGCVNTKAPWFCDYLFRYLVQDKDLGKTEDARKSLILGGGLTIKTTLDMRYQRGADQAVQSQVYATDQAIGGLAMVEPGTGYVRALAQSRPMGDREKKGETYINYTVPKRYGDSNGFQPGSTFKAFVLAAAINDQVPLNTVIDSPSPYVAQLGDFKTCNGNYQSTGTYPFQNSTGTGPYNLYTGTQNSINTFFIQLELITGLCKPWNYAEKMGVELEDPETNMTPSFTLGTQDASPLEMAEAYATFANRGVHCASTPVLEILGRDGKPMPLTPEKCNRVISPEQADAVNSILKGVIDPGGFADEQNLGRDAAGKTGTTSLNKAVWFVGYTPNMSTASMIAGASRGTGSPIELIGLSLHGSTMTDVSGSGTAAPMWGAAMRAILDILPTKSFSPPDPSVIEGQTVPIPFLGGQDPSVAAATLSRLGFNPTISTSQVNSDYPQGTVAYTSPSGEGVSGGPVMIYVSNGIPDRPDNPGGPGNGGGDGPGGPGGPGPGGPGGPGNGPR